MCTGVEDDMVKSSTVLSFLSFFLFCCLFTACEESNDVYSSNGDVDGGFDASSDTDTDTDSDSDSGTDSDADADSDSGGQPIEQKDECEGHEGETVCSSDYQARIKCPTDGSDPERIPCGDGKSCVDGKCEDWKCTPYEVECDDNDDTKYRECRPDGQGWKEDLSCPPDRFYCNEEAGGCELVCRYLVMFLVDKSGSMEGDKWTQLRQAIETLVTDPNFMDTVWFGLSIFPTDDYCEVSNSKNPQVAVAEAPSSGPAIMGTMAGITPDGMTPILDSLKFIRDNPLITFKNEKFQSILIFFTDGGGNCQGNPENSSSIGAVTAEIANQDILTYAIGFGTPSTDWAAQLNAVAQNGGTGVSTFYSADTLDSLLEVFYEIFGDFHDC